MKYECPGHLTRIEPSSDVLAETVLRLEQAKPGVPLTKYAGFSQAMGGLRPHEFTILCGATGAGKTTLLANWAHDLLLAREPLTVFSVETGPHDFVRRILESSISQFLPEGPAAKVPLMQAMQRCQERLKSGLLRLAMYEDRLRVEALIQDIADEVEERGSKIVFVDNLNFFLEVTNAADAVIEMDRVIHKLIIFCKQVPVHIVMVMHPKKTDEGRVKNEFEIKGSSTAVQEAHNVILFNRPHPDDLKSGRADKWDRELMIVKARRRGQAVGRRFLIASQGGVTYTEKGEL